MARDRVTGAKHAFRRVPPAVLWALIGGAVGAVAIWQTHSVFSLKRGRMDDAKAWTITGTGSADGWAACFTPDANHYFPAGAPQGTFVGATAIAQGWADVVARLDSRWTIDHLVIDVERRAVAIECPAAIGGGMGVAMCVER